MRKALLTFAHGDEHGKLLDVSLPLFEAYAARHGYDLICPDHVATERPPSWMKVKQMHFYLPDYDFLLWLDCDIVITDGSIDIADCIAVNSMQAVVKHYTKDGEVPNFGVWVLQKHDRVFEWLDIIWEQDQHTHAPWWEQTAALELMGYASQRRPCKLEQPSEWYYCTQFMSVAWNSHPWCQATMPRFEHVTMYRDRLATMQELARKAQWHEAH